MKKIIRLILLLTLVFCLTGCGQEKETEKDYTAFGMTVVQNYMEQAQNLKLKIVTKDFKCTPFVNDDGTNKVIKDLQGKEYNNCFAVIGKFEDGKELIPFDGIVYLSEDNTNYAVLYFSCPKLNINYDVIPED